MTTPKVKVWDPLVRVGHWTLVVCIAGAWFTRESASRWHEWLGYAALGVVAMRIVWGFTGGRHARFARFIRGPRGTLCYARNFFAAKAPRHVGHNPLGAWMIIALLGVVAATSLTGWAYTTDAFWGDPLMGQLHEGLATTLLVLAALHLAGVIFASLRHRENLVGAMVHGRKREAAGDDIA